MSNHTIDLAKDGEGYGGTYDPFHHTFTMRDPEGKIHKMDLGVGNVHVDAIMNNFGNKYANGEMKADMAFPVFPVVKASDKYWSLDPENVFDTTLATTDAAGAAVPEISLALSQGTYGTKPYGLGAFIPNEVQGNADAPLDVQMETLQLVMDRMALMRELRCMRTLFTNAAWAASNRIQLGATDKWNGGTTSDPVGVIKTGARACLEYPTHMLLARDTWDAFVQNSAVQKYPAFKSSIAPIPQTASAEQWCAMLDLPKPIIVESKAKSGATYPYVWTADVVLLKISGMVGKYSHDTCKTFRWLGAGGNATPDPSLGGTYRNGIFVRSFFNPYRGRYGGQQIIIAQDDAEIITSALNGYYIKGALQ